MWVPFSSVPDASGHATAPLLLPLPHSLSGKVARPVLDYRNGLRAIALALPLSVASRDMYLQSKSCSRHQSCDKLSLVVYLVL